MLKGIETSILPDGTLDTPLIDQEKFELVVVSIHPNVDNQAFEEIVSDPVKYGELVTRAVENPHANIVGHIGYGCKPKNKSENPVRNSMGEEMNEFNELLDWNSIAESALAHKVALEVNLKGLFKFLHKDILDENKFPKSEVGYKKAFESKLAELVPIISSDGVMSRLQPYFSEGLKLAVNTDKHSSPFVEYDIEDNSKTIINSPGHRYWVCMKILERYFNERFGKFGVKLENVINSYSTEKLESFLQKK